MHHPVDVVGALTLTGGTYAAQFSVASFGVTATPSLDVASGALATLTATNTLTTASLAGAGGLPGTVGVVLGGPGVLVNAGTLEVNLPGGPYGALTIAGTMHNDGLISLDPVTVNNYQQTFHVAGQGKSAPYDVRLTWNYVLPDQVAITAPSFSNTAVISGAGATVTIGGGLGTTTFNNSGTINLFDTTTQAPDLSARVPVLATRDLPGKFEVKAGVAFTNSGLIAAGNVLFDGDVTLASLGTLRGGVVFGGTLDLGNGTLDATATPLSVFTALGVVKNGTLIGDTSHLKLGSATLRNVLVVASASDILHDVLAGTAKLDANTLELRYSTAATTVAPLAITATGPADVIAATAPGMLTFGLATTITDVTPGSTLTLGGPGLVDIEGKVTLTGATLVTDTLTGAGTISLSGGASLTIGALDANSNMTIDFHGGGNTLFLPSSAAGSSLGLVVEGLLPGDLIDFSTLSSIPGTVFTQAGAGVQDGRLDVSAASGDQASVGVLGPTAALTFNVTPDAGGGSLLSVACFRHGTRIATPAGERAVETLRIGDLVETATGPRAIRWLGRRAYLAATVAKQRQLRPVRFRAGALGHGLPARDLDLSPLHAVFIDGALVAAAALVNAQTITRAPIADTAYVHVELDRHGVVFAEGAACETFVDCDSRAMFANAASYAEMYPGAPARTWRSFAPRLEGGWRLHGLRARLRSPRPGTAGDLRGALDTRADGVLEGWAADGAGSVELEVVAGGRQIGCVVANRYRIDLDHAGFGEPAAGFRARLPKLTPDVLAGVTVRRLSDGMTLGR